MPTSLVFWASADHSEADELIALFKGKLSLLNTSGRIGNLRASVAVSDSEASKVVFIFLDNLDAFDWLVFQSYSYKLILFEAK